MVHSECVIRAAGPAEGKRNHRSMDFLRVVYCWQMQSIKLFTLEILCFPVKAKVSTGAWAVQLSMPGCS